MYQSLIRLNTPPFIPSIWLCYVHSPPYLMDRERKCLVWSAWEEVGARVILQYNCCLVGLYCALQQCTVVCTVQYSGARWREHSHNLQVSGHWHQRWSLALPRQWSPYYHTSHYKSHVRILTQTWQTAIHTSKYTFQLWKNIRCLTVLCVSSVLVQVAFEGIWMDYLIMDRWEEDLLELALLTKSWSSTCRRCLCNYNVISKKHLNRD